MRQIFIISLLLIFSACSEKPQDANTADLEKIAELESQLLQAKEDNKHKDEMIQESLAFFNEIQNNLEVIQLKKSEIKLKSENPNLSEDDRKWIIQEIKHINFLREENVKKVNKLNKELKASGLKITELESMIEQLIQDMQSKEIDIAILHDELQTVDQEYSKLFDAYIEQEVEVDQLTDQIQTAYFTYGTAKELRANQVIEPKNGFIGVGKKTKLLDNFNEKYFTKINIMEKKEILISGKDFRFITDHPSTSYKLKEIGDNTKIIITNPLEFWKVTKYLVVLVN